MHRDNRKYIAKSEKYKGVSKVYQDNEYKWLAKSTIKYTNWHKFTETEREAALAYDMYMIKKGKSPVNILKPRS
jgi:hypothetical protein